MTEPEDLEEDLFADLYDADDSTQRAAPPAAAPSFPEPQQPPQNETNAPTVPPPQQQTSDNNQHYHIETQMEQQHVMNGDQRNGVNEPVPIAQESDHIATHVESGSHGGHGGHGTGIKEDG
ncbi:hypothetical protein EMCG_05174 [[Emmonsia] crescens]|uniref:Uncharacterized protein n=1 Tax=[Emmonsia] crescens TaxID=73230 RepID=A0A0G2J6I1_9EURO|nr:hypothetical protein EMCG_05174 [Emmonsia crescens UAMH 3008]